jgi:hypothetical protein
MPAEEIMYEDKKIGEADVEVLHLKTCCTMLYVHCFS